MAEELKLVEGEYLMYKGKPMVREGNTICYGDKSEKCILILEIMKYKEVQGSKVPDSILIQVIDSNDPNTIAGIERFMALAMDMAMEVLPTPGGPTRQSTCPFSSGASCLTATNSRMRSLTLSSPK